MSAALTQMYADIRRLYAEGNKGVPLYADDSCRGRLPELPDRCELSACYPSQLLTYTTKGVPFSCLYQLLLLVLVGYLGPGLWRPVNRIPFRH